MVKKALEKIHITSVSAELAKIPKLSIEVEEKAAIQTLKLLDRMEELDDVQKVYSNVNFTDQVIEKFNSGDYE